MTSYLYSKSSKTLNCFYFSYNILLRMHLINYKCDDEPIINNFDHISINIIAVVRL